MSLGFDCGQYEQAFNSRRLQNYEVRNFRRRRPMPKEGFTTIIANNRGHLLPSISRTMKSPWGTFVGTWGLPSKIPGNKSTDPMARTLYQHHVNCEKKSDADVVIYGKNKRRRARIGQPVQAMATNEFCMPTDQDKPSSQRSGAANPLTKEQAARQLTPVRQATPRRAVPRQATPQRQITPPLGTEIHPELVKTPKAVSPLPCEDPKTGITPPLTPAKKSPPRSRNLTPVKPHLTTVTPVV